MSNIITYSPINSEITTTTELVNVISSYFKSLEVNNTPPTVSGLGLFLNMSRYQLKTFPQSHPFAPFIKKALQYIEEYAERQLFEPKPPTGVMFSLKNNFDWQDKTEIQLTHNKSMAEIIEELNNNNMSPIVYEGEVIPENQTTPQPSISTPEISDPSI